MCGLMQQMMKDYFTHICIHNRNLSCCQLIIILILTQSGTVVCMHRNYNQNGTNYLSRYDSVRQVKVKEPFFVSAIVTIFPLLHYHEVVMKVVWESLPARLKLKFSKVNSSCHMPKHGCNKLVQMLCHCSLR